MPAQHGTLTTRFKCPNGDEHEVTTPRFADESSAEAWDRNDRAVAEKKLRCSDG